MAWQDYIDTVQKIYIAYYQRPADPLGLIYWAQMLDAAGGDLTQIIEAFANSDEAKALYEDINENTIGDVIDAIYQAAFNRSPDEEGKQFYINGFKEGKFTAATIMLNILDGARGEDLIILQNKITSANNFTYAIDPELDGKNLLATYEGNEDAEKGREFLRDVGATADTVKSTEDAQAFIKENIADEGDPILETVVTGKTFTLTNGPDVVIGTSGDDVIDGTFDANGNVTFHSFDRIDGGDGNDYLIAQGIGNLTTTPDTIKNIETIEVVGAVWNTTLDLTNTQGIKTLISNASTGPWTALNINSGIETIKVINPGGPQAFQFNTDVVTGTDNSITLEVSTVQTQTINLNPRAGVDGFETINIVATGGDSNITLNDGTSTSLKTVNVSGSADLTLAFAPTLTTVTTFDASQATGDVIVTFTGANVTATGGSGDDAFLFGNTFTKDDAVDGGGGENNILGANCAQLAAITTDLSNIKNIQTIYVQDGTSTGTIDISHFGASNVMFADRSASITINNLESGGSVIFNDDATGTTTINVENAATSSNDSVDIVFKGFTPGAAPGGIYAVGPLTIDNVETINVSLADALAPAWLGLSADGLETLNISGKFGLTLTVTSTSVSKVDASALEAAITVDLSGSTHGATIIGTAFNDTIKGSAGSDTLTGGDGRDKFVFNNFGAADKITDFSRTADDIYLDLTPGPFNANTKPNGVGNVTTTVSNKPVIFAVTTGGTRGTFKAWTNGNVVVLTANELFTAANLSALKAAVSAVLISTDNKSYLALGKVGSKLYGLWINDTKTATGTTVMKITAVRTIATVGATFHYDDIYIF